MNHKRNSYAHSSHPHHKLFLQSLIMIQQIHQVQVPMPNMLIYDMRNEISILGKWTELSTRLNCRPDQDATRAISARTLTPNHMGMRWERWTLHCGVIYFFYFSIFHDFKFSSTIVQFIVLNQYCNHRSPSLVTLQNRQRSHYYHISNSYYISTFFIFLLLSHGH